MKPSSWVSVMIIRFRFALPHAATNHLPSSPDIESQVCMDSFSESKTGTRNHKWNPSTLKFQSSAFLRNRYLSHKKIGGSTRLESLDKDRSFVTSLQQVLQQKIDILALGPVRLEVLPRKQGMLEWVGMVNRVN